ncbi:MAG: aquaporin [Alphaproteobacteria bacterium]|nr:aquaporin [Alphaproteobacteria bacterium]
MTKYFFEFLATFSFVFVTAGADLFAAPFIGYLGIAICFGMMFGFLKYVFPESHICPTFTLTELFSDYKSAKKNAIFLILQTSAAFLAVYLLTFILAGKQGYVAGTLFNSIVPLRYSIEAVFVAETILNILMALFFLIKREASAFSWGLFFTAVQLVILPITQGSLNAARSTAIFFSSKSDATYCPCIFWASAIAAGFTIGSLCYLSKKLKKQVK